MLLWTDVFGAPVGTHVAHCGGWPCMATARNQPPAWWFVCWVIPWGCHGDVAWGHGVCVLCVAHVHCVVNSLTSVLQKNMASEALQRVHVPAVVVVGSCCCCRWSKSAMARSRGSSMLAMSGRRRAAWSSMSHTALAMLHTSSSGCGDVGDGVMTAAGCCVLLRFAIGWGWLASVGTGGCGIHCAQAARSAGLTATPGKPSMAAHGEAAAGKGSAWACGAADESGASAAWVEVRSQGGTSDPGRCSVTSMQSCASLYCSQGLLLARLFCST
jgi:hypothetical protein